MKGKLFLPVFLLLSMASVSASGADRVLLLTLSGTIDPISARYVQRGLGRARGDGTALVVLALDTPGGLSVSMDQIIEAIVNSPVPVAVFISPAGARAASAGVFIAMAAHVAAMAPGTHLGAAHPVGSGGADIPGAMGEKVLSDAVAKLRSLAAMRGRNQAWAEQAVRRSRSLTDSEAVEQKVVDLRAADLPSLLAALDGRKVRMGGEERVLHTAGAEVRTLPMGFLDRLLSVIVNPDIAYILMSIGILGIIFELSAPGTLGGGIAGGIALLLAFIGFGSLPTNLGGILLIVLAVILFIVDIKAPAHGIWTAGGITAFVLGSILLFPPWRTPTLPAAPQVRVSPVTIGVMTALLTAFFVFVLSKGLAAQARRVSFGAETLTGSAAVAVSDLAPDGQVRAAGEVWSAHAEEGMIGAGERVEVVSRDGLRLTVRRVPPAPGAAADNAPRGGKS
jgi:membrane-bound serine protease (ClpP class)